MFMKEQKVGKNVKKLILVLLWHNAGAATKIVWKQNRVLQFNLACVFSEHGSVCMSTAGQVCVCVNLWFRHMRVECDCIPHSRQAEDNLN